MGFFQYKRSSLSPGLMAVPCQHHRSRRLFQRRLYRTSILLTVVVFMVFEFHIQTNLESWPEKSLYSASNTSDSFRPSNQSSVSFQQETSEYDEGFLEKVEYGIIKFLMGKVLAAHERRQKAAAVWLNKTHIDSIQDTKIIRRRPLGEPLENMKMSETMDYVSVNTTQLNNDTNYLSSSRHLSLPPPKTILLYTRFFGRRNWTGILGNSTDFMSHQCPFTNCIFTRDISRAAEADALIFHSRDFKAKTIPGVRKPSQRYIWLYHEAPGMENAGISQVGEEFFNWTYTYHRDSDLLFLYGGLQPIRGDDYNVSRPGLLDLSGETYQEYLSALGPVEPLLSNLNISEEVEYGGLLTQTNGTADTPNKRKLIAWMVSHCNTWSGRELYVQELTQYVEVDIYGKCGPLTCGKSHHDTYCYSNVLAPNYKFYLAFENSLCNDYITEKVWYPLHYGLVPVVYGGARYQEFLPPNSYIDATNLPPSQLAALLTKLGSNSELYNKYQLWRNYWKVLVPPPMCELCQRLHLDNTPATVKNPQSWWKEVNNCTTHYSFEDYPRQDLRLMVTQVDAGLKLFKRMIASFL